MEEKAYSPLLDVEDVAVSFEGRAALRGVSLQLRDGELVSLLGASGGGKTTLFNAVSGLPCARCGDARCCGGRTSPAPRGM